MLDTYRELLKEVESCEKLEDCSCTEITTHSVEARNVKKGSIGGEDHWTSYSIGGAFGPCAIHDLVFAFNTDDLLDGRRHQFVEYREDTDDPDYTPPFNEYIECGWEQEVLVKGEIPLTDAKEVIATMYSKESEERWRRLKEEVELPSKQVEIRCILDEEPKTQVEAYGGMSDCLRQLTKYLGREYGCRMAEMNRQSNDIVVESIRSGRLSIEQRKELSAMERKLHRTQAKLLHDFGKRRQ